ncbi:hypothetical protein [Pelagibacterium mangrovi]|uniref:hypothetical protein n=1 Tax=Pelagibacterium mangrovi TaxID=3119828 RepID=UPI002FC80EE3
MSTDVFPAGEKVVNALFTLQRAAARSIGYHDDALVEAIMHHCALRTAAATAPSDHQVGRYSEAEERAIKRLLTMKVTDLDGIAVRGRYLRAFAQYDPGWLNDAGVPEALLAGLAGAA